ncbi:DUF5994 family protein [Nocardioides sp. C4-1]|uniref:DUF5994 family protein n=1 Tax=Nocardioides sp. C4-1 TaxID=3151851 RepID=UPI0032667495
MATLPARPATAPDPRSPLRLWLDPGPAAQGPHGAWWPQSRDLRVEVRDLIDHFPYATGRVDRLLFSRPDWDDVVVDGRGVRAVRAERGPVKVGSFPRDDTRLVVLTMATGNRLRLTVVPSGVDAAEARRLGFGLAAGASRP